MFGRATIRLGIGPHSSFIFFTQFLHFVFCSRFSEVMLVLRFAIARHNSFMLWFCGEFRCVYSPLLARSPRCHPLVR